MPGHGERRPRWDTEADAGLPVLGLVAAGRLPHAAIVERVEAGHHLRAGTGAHAEAVDAPDPAVLTMLTTPASAKAQSNPSAATP